MKLFGALFRRKYMPNGNIWRGKNRLQQKVYHDDVLKLRDEYEIEERNMFLLRHAFLTPEQSFGHAQALGKPQKRFEETVLKKRPFRENMTIESQLAHLRYKEPWD